VVDPSTWQENGVSLPPPPPPPSDGTVERFVVVVLVAVGALYGITVLADYFGFQYFEGRFSVALLLIASIWSVGFLLLRTENQAARELYELQADTFASLHPDLLSDSSSAFARAIGEFRALARRHGAIARTRSYSAALTFYAAVFAGIAAATVLVGIGGFWALFDFLSILLLVGALIVWALGPDQLGITHRLEAALPSRWR
jgi:hypothetical protein